jgi:hypothetical protein
MAKWQFHNSAQLWLGVVAAILMQALSGSASAQHHLLRLHAVSVEAVDRENYLQIACGPAAVQSLARVRLNFGRHDITLRQEDADVCDGNWAPVWAAQAIRMQWFIDEEVLFQPGPHVVEMWDGDWWQGPRRSLAARYIFEDNGRGQIVRILREGYVLHLHYGPAYGQPSPAAYAIAKRRTRGCASHETATASSAVIKKACRPDSIPRKP